MPTNRTRFPTVRGLLATNIDHHAIGGRNVSPSMKSGVLFGELGFKCRVVYKVFFCASHLRWKQVTQTPHPGSLLFGVFTSHKLLYRCFFSFHMQQQLNNCNTAVRWPGTKFESIGACSKIHRGDWRDAMSMQGMNCRVQHAPAVLPLATKITNTGVKWHHISCMAAQ